MVLLFPGDTDPYCACLCMSSLKGTFFTFISEFDQFLVDRAAAGGQRTASVKSGASRPRQRQMQMENQADDEMFGL